MTISVNTTASPPTADLFLSSLPAGTASVWVWRQWANREDRVRGDAKTAVVGTEARLVDYDIPVGMPVAYRAQCFAADGSELDPLPATSAVEVSLDDPTTLWLSDPLAPALARLLVKDGNTDGSRTYSADVTFAQVIGRAAPTAISGTRSAAGEWTFTLKAFSHDESQAIEDLVSGGGTLLIRTDPTTVRHRTGLIYLAVPTVTEQPRHDMVWNPGRADWVLTGQEVQAPGLNVVQPLREYQDVVDENVDYTDVRTKYADYLALLRG